MSSTKYNAEEMASFFNKRAEGYEEHMKKLITFDRFYGLVASGIKATEEKVEILDIGCGTGLEIEYILKKAPNARIRCIDLSAEMLKLLKQKYAAYEKQLDIVEGSYVDLPFGENRYDYVISVCTMHHFLEDIKANIYEKICRSLKSDGVYLEADYVVDEQEEREALQVYFELMSELDNKTLYHIDIPFSMKTQERLLEQCGFDSTKVLYEEYHGTIIAAAKSSEANIPSGIELTILRYKDEHYDMLHEYLANNNPDEKIWFEKSLSFIAFENYKVVGFVQLEKPSMIKSIYYDKGREDVGSWLNDIAEDYFDRVSE